MQAENGSKRVRRRANEWKVRLLLFIGSVFVYEILLGDVGSMFLQEANMSVICGKNRIK